MEGMAIAFGMVLTVAWGVCLGMLSAWLIRGVCREIWQSIQALDKWLRG